MIGYLLKDRKQEGKMEMKKISVIIPVYNTEKCLERCLNSILTNTYKNLEIICINDGSTDGSLNILQRIAAADDRIRIIDKPNEGVSTARNAGLRAAVGDFIAFIDSDDWIHSRYFETLLYHQKQTKADIVVCRFKRANIHTSEPVIEPMKTRGAAWDVGKFLTDGWMKRSVWGRIYSRKVIGRKIRFPEYMTFAEDMVFNLMVVGSRDDIKISVVEEELYYYFVREGSAATTHNMGDLLSAGIWGMEHIDEAQNQQGKRIYLLEALKVILSTRYYDIIIGDKRTAVQKRRKLFSEAWIYMKELNNITRMEKIVYRLFGMSPFLYRMFRIATDRTMLDYEKQLKRQYGRDLSSVLQVNDHQKRV